MSVASILVVQMFLYLKANEVSDVCWRVCRNTQRHSSDKPRPLDDYETLDLETRGQQPQYDVMPRAERQSDNAHYIEL